MDAISGDVNESNYHHGDESNADTNLPINSGQRNQSNTKMIQCACGNKFKGLRGIKKHQRSCRIIRGLDKELLSESSYNYTVRFIASTLLY